MDTPEFLKIIVSGKRDFVQINDTTKVEIATYDPIDVKVTDFMAKSIGLPYKLMLPVDGQYGRLIPGTNNWTGMMGMIQRGEADMAVSILTLTEERSKAVPFSYPYAMGEITFVTKKPEYSPNLAVFLWPFSKEVWISVAVCLIVIPVMFHLLCKKSNSLFTFFISTLRIFLRQNLQQQPQTLTDYILLSHWMLGSTFISFFYSAVLLSFLSFPPLKGIRTIPELSAGVARGEYQCTTHPGGFVSDALLNSIDPLVQVIGHNLKENRGSNDIDSVLESNDGKKPVFIGGLPHFIPLKDRYFVSKDIFFNAFAATAVRKGFCCTTKLNRGIQYYWASGLHEKMSAERGFLKRLGKNLRSTATDGDSERKLTVGDFAGPFLFLLSSYTAALLLFIAELVAGKRRVNK